MMNPLTLEVDPYAAAAIFVTPALPTLEDRRPAAAILPERVGGVAHYYKVLGF